MSATYALSNSFLRRGFVVLAAFLVSCGVRTNEIDPGAGSHRPFGCAVFDNAVYFSAFEGTSGFELWKSDGTVAGTVRVKDINPGPGGSSPFGFTISNNALYFSADDGRNGFELWKSDGTEAGTVRVKGISGVNVPQDAGGTLNSASLRPKVSWRSCKSTFAWTGVKPGTQPDKRRRTQNGIQHQNSGG